MNITTSKSIWVGVIMVATGVLGLVLPEAVTAIGVAGDPSLLIGNGFGIIALRLGIAKNGQNV